MGRMKHEHHEEIVANADIDYDEVIGMSAAEEDYYAEIRRQERNKRKERDKNLPVAPPVFPHFGGRRNYPANPATDAQRFEEACRAADKEAVAKGMNIVVFKNREDNYFTWEEKYISDANPVEALYTAKAPEVK